MEIEFSVKRAKIGEKMRKVVNWRDWRDC